MGKKTKNGIRDLPVLVITFVCFIIIAYNIKFLIAISFPLPEIVNLPPGYNELKAWAENNIQEGDVYLAPRGTYHFQLFSKELKERNFTYPLQLVKALKNNEKQGRYMFPVADSMEELQDYIKRNNVSYVILSPYEIDVQNNFLKEYFTADVEKWKIRQIKDVAGWKLILKDPENSDAYLVYAMEQGSRDT
jgi:hypothetical protein